MKNRNQQTDPKTRIFNSAITLFAQKGFGVVGMRELAEHAQVNLAMINYYFGSKVGVLKDIIHQFLTGYIETVKAAVSGEDSIEIKMGRLLPKLIAYLQENQGMLIITYSELPHDSPEIAEFKARYVNALKEYMMDTLGREFYEKTGVSLNLAVIGPALLAMISSHFILKPLIENMDGVVLDAEFYREYPRCITNLFLHGVTGMIRQGGVK